MEINNNDAFEMSFKNRYKVFPIKNRAKYIDELYEPYKVRGLQEIVLKNSPKYQYSDDRKEGYIISQGIDEKGYYAIFLPAENEYEKIKAFAEIKDKLVKLSELANLQRQLTKRNKTLLELNSIEKEIDKLYIDIFGNNKTIEWNTAIEISHKNTTKLHSHIFCNDGFELFEYILENHIASINKRGRYSDIAYYYWKMYEDNYIIQRPQIFINWFLETYQELISKLKTKNEVENPNRKKHYSTSLDNFKKTFNNVP